MHYAVSARLIEGRAREFHRKLTDGTIAAQSPDGAEIADSMARARIGADGVARWTEHCYCSTPLKHERATVLDTFFRELATEPIADDAELTFEGAPLLDRLASAG
jgi:hypothetical protein